MNKLIRPKNKSCLLFFSYFAFLNQLLKLYSTNVGLSDARTLPSITQMRAYTRTQPIQTSVSLKQLTNTRQFHFYLLLLLLLLLLFLYLLFTIAFVRAAVLVWWLLLFTHSPRYDHIFFSFVRLKFPLVLCCPKEVTHDNKIFYIIINRTDTETESHIVIV